MQVLPHKAKGAMFLDYAPYLVPVEPQAPKATEHPGLQEGNPASMKLHDDCKGTV